ncbi:MAG TPA: IS481 family transposase [Sporichthya sp.]|nr:IS481 family transposase [Sporichthya sp.]
MPTQSKARLVLTALLVEARPVAEIAAAYGVHRSWIYKLKVRYDAEGEAAYQPRSRRPKTSPTAIPAATVEAIVRLRKELTGDGLDAGPDTIAWHLAHHHGLTVSVSTIARTLTRQQLAGPEPNKRPKSSYIRFAAEFPNELWQSDFTHYPLADGTDCEVITWIDDHSRFVLGCRAFKVVTAQVVLDTFTESAGQHGYPASTLTDNGMVYTVRLHSRLLAGGRTKLEAELRRLGIVQKNSRPAHPTTCGKVERFQQTLKKWLRAQPVQPTTLAELQALIDAFIDTYNHRRPHRSLPNRCTPATAYLARPKAAPSRDRTGETHDRVRHDIVDTGGTISLRVHGKLRHIGIGRTHARTRVIVLIQDLDVRVVHATTGELLRELTIDLTRDYQPTGRPPGPKRKTEPSQ